MLRPKDAGIMGSEAFPVKPGDYVLIRAQVVRTAAKKNGTTLVKIQGSGEPGFGTNHIFVGDDAVISITGKPVPPEPDWDNFDFVRADDDDDFYKEIKDGIRYYAMKDDEDERGTWLRWYELVQNYSKLQFFKEIKL